MFARVATYHGSPNRLKEGTRVVEEITPELQQMPGFQRAYLLMDNRSGNAIAMSLWGTEEETNRSTPVAASIRDRIGQTIGSREKPTVEIYEIAAEFGRPTEAARFVRVSTYHGVPGKVEDGIRVTKETTPDVQRLPDIRGGFFLVDRKSGKAMTMTLWKSEDAVNRSASGANPIRDRIAQALGGEKPTVEVFELAGEVPQRARKAA